MNRSIVGAACSAVLLAAAVPHAAAQDSTAARNLAAACFTCHGTDGHSAGGIPPSLAGQNRNYLLQQMRDFKSGKRPATIMHQQAKGYTDQELQTLASYFAGVKSGAASPAPASMPMQGSY
jgi:cytochrome c553